MNVDSGWILAFSVFWLIEFVLFGMQRATLLISRNAGIEWRRGGELLLPAWYPLTWIIRVAKWAVLLWIGYSSSWKIALIMLIADIVLSFTLPIPYAAYKSGFRRRVRRIAKVEPDLGRLLQELLDSAPF